MNRPSNFMPTPDQDVLDIKPLRTLAPMFPAPLGVHTDNQSTTPPLIFVTSAEPSQGSFGAWNNSAAKSFFAFGGKDACGGNTDTSGDRNADGGKAATFGDQNAVGSHNADVGDQNCAGGQPAAHWTTDVSANANGPIDATPISAYRATPPNVISLDDDDDDDNDDENYVATQTSASGRKIKRPSRLSSYNMKDDLGSDSSNTMKIKRSKPSHKKASADNAVVPLSGDPREIVEAVLMTFEALRRRHLQMDEAQETSKRADLKAGNIMMSKNLRANTGKRIGVVPGVEIGDIFYFRIGVKVREFSIENPTSRRLLYREN